MKKIMIIMPELYHGGAEKQFRAIITGLGENGYEIIVVDEHLYGDADPELINRFSRENKNVKYIELKARKCKRLLKYGLINKDMLFILIKYKPDLVFSSSLKLSSLCKFLGVPFVYSERNSAEGEKYYREKKKALISAKKVTCNSISAKEAFAKNGIIAQYIANGIEECEMMDCVEIPNIITVPARISVEKNQEIVVDALSQLPKDLVVYFVGKVSEEEYREKLEKKIRDLQLQDRVKLITFTNDIKNIYRKSSVIVLPSITEGLSNVILESYMFGRICVLSDIPQNRNAGSKGQRYFNPYSPEMLCEKIKEVLALRTTEYAEECRENHKYVIENYSMSRMVKEYQQVFDDVISQIDYERKSN